MRRRERERIFALDSFLEGVFGVSIMVCFRKDWICNKIEHRDVGMVFHSTLESGCHLQTLVPDLEEAVPGPCCHCHAIVSHTQAAHPVIMTGQDTCTVGLQSVPDVAVEIVIASQQ